MRDFLLVLFALLCAFGCSSNMTPSVAPALDSPTDFDLQAAWEQLRPRRAGETISYDNCPPVPLPEVTYRIGQVMASRGELKVPVYLDTGGLPTYGGLLRLSYEGRRISPVRIEPGDAWAQADFVHAIDNVISDGDYIWLILGWELQYGETCPIPAEKLALPFVYMVFDGIKPGKAKIDWMPVPDGETGFFRRGECIVDDDGCLWDVIDFYRSRPNQTGLMNVEPGHVIVTP